MGSVGLDEAVADAAEETEGGDGRTCGASGADIDGGTTLLAGGGGACAGFSAGDKLESELTGSRVPSEGGGGAVTGVSGLKGGRGKGVAGAGEVTATDGSGVGTLK